MGNEGCKAQGIRARQINKNKNNYNQGKGGKAKAIQEKNETVPVLSCLSNIHHMIMLYRERSGKLEWELEKERCFYGSVQVLSHALKLPSKGGRHVLLSEGTCFKKCKHMLEGSMFQTKVLLGIQKELRWW